MELIKQSHEFIIKPLGPHNNYFRSIGHPNPLFQSRKHVLQERSLSKVIGTVVGS